MIMRLKKGDRVEVLTKCEVPSGSWRCATIVSCKARKYIVTYDVPKDFEGGSHNIDRVPRSALRPMPPPIGGLDDLHRGDIVEVFHLGSWKAASVVTTGERRYYFVRLHGAGQDQMHVHIMNLRLRQSWQDDEWFVTGKNRRRMRPTTAVSGESPPPPTKKIKVAAV